MSFLTLNPILAGIQGISTQRSYREELRKADYEKKVKEGLQKNLKKELKGLGTMSDDKINKHLKSGSAFRMDPGVKMILQNSNNQWMSPPPDYYHQQMFNHF